MKKVNIDFERFKSFLFKYKFVVGAFIFLLVSGLILIPRAFAQPVKSVEIISDSASFEDKTPGAWKVDKSAKWTGKGEAEITFDVDSIIKTNTKYTDVLFVLDVSGSMSGDKLDRVKADSIELIESLLSNGENKAGLITFESTSDIILDFTKDEELLKEKINSLSATGCTNYYRALANVDEVLKNYKKEKGRECIVLFLTDGYPNEDTPNEETQYSYLKQQYPFITINGIQYEMGTNVLEPIKKVSDNQFIADMDTLNNVLFDASAVSVPYDNFELTDYIDTNYFYVEDENKIKVSQGNINFDRNNQKVTWTINEFKSGFKAKMNIKVKLKEEFIGIGGFYPTNTKEEIKSKLDGVEEDVDSNKTPVLSDNYKVIYDANVPKGCNLEGNVPITKNHSVFDTVKISDASLKCEDYQFKGWEVITENANWLNGDYFTMPEEDVIIKAKWGKLSIDKAMDGEVHEHVPATLETYSSYSTSNYGLHKYKDSITDIIFQDVISRVGGAIEVLDISAEKNNGILAYIVPNEDDSTKYTAYIQGDGAIVANSYSSYLFYEFKNLKSIQNLEYLDTSNVTNMSYMFCGCKSLTNLDVSNFDTTKVTNMSFMFYECKGLTNLDVGNFDTTKVTNMSSMFEKCRNLSNLNVSNFDTTKVTNMSSMFENCRNLSNLNISNFDTTNVTNMSSMFAYCINLSSLNVSNFITSSVTNMHAMFCGELSDLGYMKIKTIEGLNNFDTSNVTDMGFMFYECRDLENLDLSNFNTSKVTTLSNMFGEDISLLELDLSNFDTSNVTDMSDMFSGINSDMSLKRIIGLSSFNTSKVTSMKSMFSKCNALEDIDVSNFDTSNVINMSYMFSNSSFSGMDLSNFDTSNVTNMSSMFSGYNSSEPLNLSSFDTSNVTNMESMFSRYASPTPLNLSSLDTSSVKNMNSMFSGYASPEQLNLSSLNTSNVSDMSYMFASYNSSEPLDLSSFDTSNVTNMRSMFSHSNLVSLDLSNFDTSKVTNMSGMFEECINLENLNIDIFDTSNVASMQFLFYKSPKISTTIKIMNPNVSDYRDVFRDAATVSGSKIIVKYVSSASDLVDKMISTAWSASRIIKGDEILEYDVVMDGNNDVELDIEKAFPNKNVYLKCKDDNYSVVSFKVNGLFIKGNKFKMPEVDVVITDVVTGINPVIESEHGPYPNSLNAKVYGERTFNGATSLTVELDYQTEKTNYDWIYLYDSTGKAYGKYGGSTRKKETIIIPGDYVKVVFRTDSSGNNYYGFKATITPNYA